MGVSLLIGEADGTRHGAAMYDNTTGWMVGPVWEADDAEDQIEAFLEWLRNHPTVAAGAVVGGGLDSRQARTFGTDGTDPRHWTDGALALIVKLWRAQHVGDDGLLAPAAAETV